MKYFIDNKFFALEKKILSKVKTITADEALKLSNEGKCNLIDI